VRPLTFGAANIFSSQFSNEFRSNVAQNHSGQSYRVDAFGNATPYAETDIPGLSDSSWFLCGLAYELAEFRSESDVLNNTPGYFVVNHSAKPAMKWVDTSCSVFLHDEGSSRRG
jgi:hypothetical protein